MNTKQLQSIKLLSINAVQSLYTQNYASVFPLLHPDATYINSTDNQFRQGGKAALAEFWTLRKSFRMPAAAQVSVSLTCQLLYSDLESCAVLCTCSTRLRQEYCTTLLWKSCREGLFIYHIHASQSALDETPVLTFTGRNAECFYLKPDDILYVETDNTCTSLICLSCTLKARQSISAVKNVLPEYFLQIHRSFLVNIHYITGLRRYTLELRGGAQLPIPEKRYKWLKEYLENLR